MEKTVAELFAGVGGFRVGLNGVKLINNKTIEENIWQIVFANQWEPSTKQQHAFECYTHRFGESENHVNEDISKISKKDIPDHTLLVGGFPCQDYSVARGLSGEKGIQGKKGVLWWEITKVIRAKKPPFILLENVDRLLKSPSTQRGRDFGIMLRTLSDLGYGTEWRVINAADYGHPQRRRRVFIFSYHKSTNFYKNINTNLANYLHESGFFSRKFPVDATEHEKHKPSTTTVSRKNNGDLVSLSDNFKHNFHNAGIMHKGNVYTEQVEPIKSKSKTLSEIVLQEKISQKYFIQDESKWKFLKGAKRIERVKPNGEKYFFSEGSMSYPDRLDLPGRTMLTSESSVNRSSHVIKDMLTNKVRKITPVEAERLNEFPDNWTDILPDSKRYFMMGNALVCGIVSKLSEEITKIINNE